MLCFSDEPGPPPPPTPTHVDRTSIHLTWSPPDDDGGSEVTATSSRRETRLGTSGPRSTRNLSVRLASQSLD